MNRCTIEDDCTGTYHGRGMCRKHYQRWLTNNRKRDLPRCVSCDQPIRPPRAAANYYPGTVAPGAGGQCMVCYRKTLAADMSEEDREREARNLAYIERGLNSYIARRNARLDAMERTYRLAA